MRMAWLPAWVSCGHVQLSALAPAVGPYPLDDTRLASWSSGGQEFFQQVLFEDREGFDQDGVDVVPLGSVRASRDCLAPTSRKGDTQIPRRSNIQEAFAPAVKLALNRCPAARTHGHPAGARSADRGLVAAERPQANCLGPPFVQTLWRQWPAASCLAARHSYDRSTCPSPHDSSSSRHRIAGVQPAGVPRSGGF